MDTDLCSSGTCGYHDPGLCPGDFDRGRDPADPLGRPEG